jgi:hypothetical protein
MKITRRGWAVLVITLFALVVAFTWATRDFCWYGEGFSCQALHDKYEEGKP